MRRCTEENRIERKKHIGRMNGKKIYRRKKNEARGTR